MGVAPIGQHRAHRGRRRAEVVGGDRRLRGEPGVRPMGAGDRRRRADAHRGRGGGRALRRHRSPDPGHPAASRPGWCRGGRRCRERAALEAEGEWVLRIEAGDLLRPDALHRIVARLAARSDADVVYADEDRLSHDGDLKRPELKPIGHPSTCCRGTTWVIPRPCGAACCCRWAAGGLASRRPKRTMTCTSGLPSRPVTWPMSPRCSTPGRPHSSKRRTASGRRGRGRLRQSGHGRPPSPPPPRSGNRHLGGGRP